MGYWTYYLMMMALWYLVGHPVVLAGVVVLFLLRGFIPDPYVLARTAGRRRALQAQISANPANATARRAPLAFAVLSSGSSVARWVPWRSSTRSTADRSQRA